MAKPDKKKKGNGVRKAIKAAGPNISKKEMQQITVAAGGNVQKAIDKISSAGANLAAGAANMLIKPQQKSPFALGRSGFGDSKIAQTLRQMAGRPDYRSAKQRQMGLGPGATPGTGMMMGGTVIRPSGKMAVKKRPAKDVTQPAAADDDDETTTPGLTEEEINKRIQEGIQSGINDYFNTLDLDSIFGQQTQDDTLLNAITGMGDLFSTAMGGFQQSLSDQMVLMNQLAAPQQMERFFGAGQNYYTDAVRAAQRNRPRRIGYLRGGMGIGKQSGVTAGAPTSSLNIGPALGVLGGVTG